MVRGAGLFVIEQRTQQQDERRQQGHPQQLGQGGDITGGVGSNFIVTWTGDSAMLSPLAETVMVTGPGTPGPSFALRGRVINRRAAE